MPFSTLCRCLVLYACHKGFCLSVGELHQKIFNCLFKGTSQNFIRDKVEEFLDYNLQKILNPIIFERFKQDRAKGNYCLILSSSPDFLVGAIAKRLGASGWEASEYQADDEGKLEKISQIIDGQDKAEFVEKLSKELKIPRSHITVYSDSFLDLPVLVIAGKSVGVNPDRKLKKICKRNGWEIL